MNDHCSHLQLKFSVSVKDRQDKLPTMYLLPKLHKKAYNARFIANSRSCTTTELFKLLTSCLTAVKTRHKVLRKKFMKGQVKISFGLLKILVRYSIN